MWPIGRKGDEIVVDGRPVLPIDVWAAVESVDACAMGLFQVIRAAPARPTRCACASGTGPRLPANGAAVADAVRAAVATAIGLEPEVELVPDAALLKLGPPHKIPRVAPR